MKKMMKALLFAMLLGIMVLTVPGKANAQLSTSEGFSFWPSDDNFLDYVSFAETASGKVQLKVRFSAARVKGDNFVFCAVDADDKIFVRETVAKSELDMSSLTYTFKYEFTPASALKIIGCSADKSDSSIISNAQPIVVPAIVKDPYQNPVVVPFQKGTKNYSGSISGEKPYQRVQIYKLDAKEDCMINITNFKPSADCELRIKSYDEELSPYVGPDHITEITDEYNKLSQTNNTLKNFALKKGLYYVFVSGPNEATYSFNMEFRPYVHAKCKWSIKEGDVSSAFPQNKTLHITFEITNADSDGLVDDSKTSLGWSSSGTSGNKYKVSNNKRKATFTYKTSGWPNIDTISLWTKELNSETGKDLVRHTVDITTGIAMSDVGIVTGSNYIAFTGFKSPIYVNDGTTKITGYLKVGKKWKKKFTVKSGSNVSRTIKKLKPNKKYQVKIVVSKKITRNGKTKTVNSSKVVKVKTGPKTKPVVASARVTNYKKEKVWNPGHWDGNNQWHPGNWMTNTSYTMTVTLKKPLKKCKGLAFCGHTCKGTGTTFTVNGRGEPPTKISVKGYTDNKYFGYTQESNTVSVTR